MQRADSLSEAPPPRKRRRWLRWTIGGTTAALAGLFLLYLRITAPVMSREEMQPYFDAAKEYLTSASPERLALGTRYLDILSEMNDAAGDADEVELDGEEGAAAREELLASGRGSIEKLRALAAEGPGALGHINYVEDDVPALSSSRVSAVVMLLRADMLEAIPARDFPRVRDDVRAAFAVAETFEHRGAIIPRLAATKLRARACEQIVQARMSLDGDSIREISAMLVRVEEGIPSFEEFVWGEIDLTRAILAQSAPKKVPALINRVAVKGGGLVLQHLLELKALAAKPSHEAMAELQHCEQRLLQEEYRLIPWPWTRQCLVILPALHHVFRKLVDDLARLRGTRLVLALELYARAKGAYPEKLALLVPEHIEALPRDPFSGEDFRYARREDSYLLYSVGRDLEDDGGVVDQFGSYDGENRAPRILATGPDLVIFGAPAEEE